MFACIIDGEARELTALDYAFLLMEGHDGSMGGQCGTIYEEPDPRPLSVKVDEVEAAFDAAQREYNSPEAVAKRKADYEELQRLGELRRMDFYCGHDMDLCHPLPWQQAKYDGGKDHGKENP